MRPPERWSSARVTLVLAGLTVASWLIASALGISDLAAIRGGFIPARVNGGVDGAGMAPLWLTPLTATLVHAGLLHLLLNLVVLLFCGRPLENILGPVAFAILYVLGAYAAAAGHYFLNFEDRMPMIGASGAISAIVGAYALLFGNNRVRVANHRLAVWLNALWLGAAWTAIQLLCGFTYDVPGAQLAVGAHIGGFLVGLLLARPLLLYRYRGA